MRRMSTNETVNDEQLPGQMDIYEYLKLLKPIPVDIIGICDDAVCPICKHEFLYPKENDREFCPSCGQRMDWKRWHLMNDTEVNDENT